MASGSGISHFGWISASGVGLRCGGLVVFGFCCCGLVCVICFGVWVLIRLMVLSRWCFGGLSGFAV